MFRVNALGMRSTKSIILAHGRTLVVVLQELLPQSRTKGTNLTVSSLDLDLLLSVPHRIPSIVKLLVLVRGAANGRDMFV